MSNKGLAHAIRVLRATRGLGQVELARRAGLRQAQVSRIENDAGNPTKKTLEAIAVALEAHLVLVPYERISEVGMLSDVSEADLTDPGDVFDDVFISDDEG